MSYYGDGRNTYGEGGYTNQGGYGGGGSSSYSNSVPLPPPQVPRPWFAEWDAREGRYIFINEQSGERRHEPPRSSYSAAGYDGGYGGNSYGGPSGPGGVGGYDNERVQSPAHETKSGGGHGLLYGALGAAAGLAGGAFLMHEGHEVKEDWERDEDRVEAGFDRDETRVEQGFDRFGNRVEEFPEDAAGWAGRKVGEVEDIPQDVEQGFDRFGNRIEGGFDNAVQDVEDAPEDVAGWVGNKVGDVERFGDNIDDAYDEGRAQGIDDNW